MTYKTQLWWGEDHLYHLEGLLEVRPTPLKRMLKKTRYHIGLLLKHRPLLESKGLAMASNPKRFNMGWWAFFWRVLETSLEMNIVPARVLQIIVGRPERFNSTTFCKYYKDAIIYLDRQRVGIDIDEFYVYSKKGQEERDYRKYNPMIFPGSDLTLPLK